MSKLIIAGNEIIPGTITVTTNNSTITPKDDLRVILNISAVGAVTLSDGTDTTQRVEVFNVSSSACSITYKGNGGNVTYSLRNASGMTLLWTGTYWKATIAGLITGTDANGASINYTSEATIDLHEEPVQYSTTEQDTGKTWIDGNAIYRRVITGTWDTYTDNSNRRGFGSTILTSVGFLVNGCGTYHTVGGTEDYFNRSIPGSTMGGSLEGQFASMFIFNSTSKTVGVVLQCNKSLGVTSVAYTITLEYTKTTD